MLDIYASPSGTGNGLSASTPGSIATVRAAAATSSDDVTVYLGGGTYTFSETLALTSADSAATGKTVVWRPVPGASVIFSGGSTVTGWTLHDPNKSIWRASVGGVFRQLWVNGLRASRATRTASLNTNNDGQTWTLSGSVPQVARPQDLEIVCPNGLDWTGNVWTDTWSEPRLGVVSQTTSGGNITALNCGTVGSETIAAMMLGERHWQRGSRLENAYEFLSAATPGCWYHDAGAGTLYYVPRPGENMATAEVVVPGPSSLVSFVGVSGVEFHGITFRYAGWTVPTTQKVFLERQANAYWNLGTASALLPPGAIDVRSSTGVKIYRCFVSRCGAAGIFVGEDSTDCEVIANVVTDTSSSGIIVAKEPMQRPAYPTTTDATGITVRSNYVHDIGAEFHGAVGIFFSYVDGCVVTHNEITSTPYTGLSFGWGWDGAGYENVPAGANEIGWNKIADVMKVLDDGGAIYTLGYQAARSSIHDNYLGSPPASHALYNDQGSWNYDITANVVESSLYWYHGNGTRGGLVFSGNYGQGDSHVLLNGVETYGTIPATSIGADPGAWPQAARDIADGAGIEGAYFDIASLTEAQLPAAETTYLSDTEWECLVPVSEAPGTFEAVASTGETASIEVRVGESGAVSLGATAGMSFNANHGISRGTQTIKPGGFLWSGTRAVGTTVTVTRVGP